MGCLNHGQEGSEMSEQTKCPLSPAELRRMAELYDEYEPSPA